MNRILNFFSRHGLPQSLIFFAAAAAVFLLQVFPYTGLFLMFVLAPFWSVPLINLGFVGLAVEALWRRVPRWWVALPLLWFGGYAIAAGLEHRLVALERERLKLQNEKVTLPFDPANNDLVVSGSGLSDEPSKVLRNFEVPVVYSYSGPVAVSHRAHRIIGFKDAARLKHRPTDTTLPIVSESIIEGHPPRISRRIAEIIYPDDPTRPTVTFKLGERRSGRLERVPIHYVHIEAWGLSGARAKLTAGYASPLPWLPMPLAGCFLNSGPGKWECAAEFYRPTSVPLTPEKQDRASIAELIASSLGLESLSPERHRPTPIPSALEREAARAVEAGAKKPMF